jgi:hypothetical protein
VLLVLLAIVTAEGAAEVAEGAAEVAEGGIDGGDDCVYCVERPDEM